MPVGKSTATIGSSSLLDDGQGTAEGVVDRAARPGAQHGVDDRVCPFRRASQCVNAGLIFGQFDWYPYVLCSGSFARGIAATGDYERPDRDAHLRQPPRSHKAVSSVVSGANQYKDPCTQGFTEVRNNLVCHRPPGVFH